MAQWFILTFVGALLLGLIIPSIILVLLIVICRRRHRRSHPGYANSKLFNTNLWYYIGGNDHMFDDPNNGRGRGSTPGRGTGGFLSGTTDDFMDLPDVVVPGGRIMQNNGMGTMRQTSATMGRPNKGIIAQGTMIPQGMMSSGYDSSYSGSGATQNLGTLTMGRSQQMNPNGPWMDFQQQQQMMQPAGMNANFMTMGGQQAVSQNVLLSSVSQPGIQSVSGAAGTQAHLIQHQQSVPMMSMAGQHIVGLGHHAHSMDQMNPPHSAPMMVVPGTNQMFHPLNPQQLQTATSQQSTVEQPKNDQTPVSISHEQIQRMAQNGTLSVHIGAALAAANSAPGGPSMTMTTQDALDLLQSVTNNAGTLRGMDTLATLGTTERPPPAYNEGPVLPPRKPAQATSDVKTSEANAEVSPTGAGLAGKYGLPVAEI